MSSYYHGTSEENWEEIKKRGLRRGSYISNDLEVAEFNKTDLVLELSIPKSWVKEIDYPDHFLTLRIVPPSRIKKLV